MSISSFIARVALLAPLAFGPGCSSAKSQLCAHCDAGGADTPIGSDGVLPQFDVPPDAQPSAPDEPMASDGTETVTVDGSAQDGAVGEAAGPSQIPDGGYLFYSDFEEGSAIGWSPVSSTDAQVAGTDWSVIVGSDGAVYSEGVLDNAEWRISYASENPTGDQIVEARLRVDDFYAAAPSYVAAIFARYDPDTDSGYFMALRGDGSVIIRKREQGKSASWTAGADAGIAAGTWYMARLEILGNTANAFLDGKLVYSVVDSSPLAAGTMAIGTYGATVEVDSIFMARP